MQWFVFGFLVGAVLGAAIAIVVGAVRARAARRQTAAILAEAQQQMRDAFGAVAAEALDANSRRLAEQAGGLLDGRKALIDQTLKGVEARLEQVRQYVQKVDAERRQDVGRLTASLGSLTQTTGELHRMLASTQRRGAWGERMAEDVLRLAGLQERINYVRQDASYAAGDRERPDFTFFLPNELKVNMDVKFPLDAYKAYVDAEDDGDRAAAMKQLVSAVKGHVRDVAGRGYIDESIPTVPYVIVFVPSEQIYCLMLDAEPDLMDEALRQKVVLAGPLTLYAMLAVMRQAAQNANVARTAREVTDLLSEFYRQWQRYCEEIDRLGNQLQTVQRTYDSLVGTRTNQLQKPLDKIEQLRQSRALPEQ